MTVRQAISAVRTLLDQSGEEFYLDIDIMIALEDAQVLKAREYYYSGRKSYIQSLYSAETLNNGVLTGKGDVTHTLLGEPMIFEACFVRLYPNEGTFKRFAVYMDPLRYASYLFSGGGGRSGKLQYTFVGNTLRHNGSPNAGVYEARAVYYREPTIPTMSSPFSLPAYVHGDIVDRAAELLHMKNPGQTDHDSAGKTSDLLEKQ